MSKKEIKIFTDEVLTVGDIMKRFNVTEHTVNRWMNDGLPYVKVGNKRMTTVPVFEKWTQREEN
jgi:hypothetical protein